MPYIPYYACTKFHDNKLCFLPTPIPNDRELKVPTLSSCDSTCSGHTPSVYHTRCKEPHPRYSDDISHIAKLHMASSDIRDIYSSIMFD